MADINQVITMGIGTPARIKFFLTMGLSLMAPFTGETALTLEERGLGLTVRERNAVLEVGERSTTLTVREGR